MKLLTSSSARTFHHCTRKYHYSYVQGYRARSHSVAVQFGDVMHKLLEQYWLNRAGLLKTEITTPDNTLSEYERIRLNTLFLAYQTIWDRRDCEVIAVEHVFNLPLINWITQQPDTEWGIGGKIDLLIRDSQGIAIVEHKTTSQDASAGSDYRKRLTLDVQVGQYIHASELIGYPTNRVIYDVIRKPDLDPLLATPIEKRKYKKDGTLYANQRANDETLEEFTERLALKVAENLNRYFEQVELVRLEEERREYSMDVWKLTRQIDLVESMSLHTTNADACFRYGPCEYFSVCEGRAQLDDASLFRHTDTMHEELTVA